MFKKISRIAQSARTQSAMMALMGYPVVGKTTCLKYLSMQHKNTYYVACTHLHSTEMLIEDIFAAFGFKPEKMAIRGGKRRRKAMLEEIAEAASYAESPLLILDDIHHLGIGIYQDLKVLFDATEGQLAILLVGTPTLEIQLKRWAGYSELNEKLRSKPRPVMWELLRRVKGHFYNLEGLSKDDLLVVLKAFGVADKRIAAYFINNPMLEMGMFTEKLRKGLEVSEKEQIPVTLELMQEI
jgi:type II secretory pathway predicted ATPase ExeA